MAKLQKKYQYNKEVRRIMRHRHLPKLILKKKKLRQVKLVSKHRKENNVRAHSKVGSVPYVAERKSKIDGVQE
jgi:WD repeat and SOF domain-containing protein 1